MYNTVFTDIYLPFCCRFPCCCVVLCACVSRYLIIENFIPPEEKNKIMNRLVFDTEEDQWKFQPLVPSEK